MTGPARPPVDGLERLATAAGIDGPPRVLRRLRGGIGAVTHVVAFGDRRVVLKRYRPGSDVMHEWEGLSFAHRQRLPAPEPVAVDAGGDWFGCPTLAMSLVPGRPLLDPDDPGTYADDVVDVLLAVHGSPLTDLPAVLQHRPHRVDEIDLGTVPRSGHLPPATVDRICGELSDRLASLAAEARVPIHGDFHPGNLVWCRQRLQGVVDWSAARPASRWAELAYFRIELEVLAGADVARRVQTVYERRLGCRSPTQVTWDLLHVLNAHLWMHAWLDAYREQGAVLSLAVARRRLRALAAARLAELPT